VHNLRRRHRSCAIIFAIKNELIVNSSANENALTRAVPW